MNTVKIILLSFIFSTIVTAHAKLGLNTKEISIGCQSATYGNEKQPYEYLDIYEYKGKGNIGFMRFNTMTDGYSILQINENLMVVSNSSSDFVNYKSKNYPKFTNVEYISPSGKSSLDVRVEFIPRKNSKIIQAEDFKVTYTTNRIWSNDEEMELDLNIEDTGKCKLSIAAGLDFFVESK